MFGGQGTTKKIIYNISKQLTMKTMNAKVRIQMILECYEKPRNESAVLITMFWTQELNDLNYDINRITAMTLLRLISTKQLTSSETIRRTKAKIQEEIPRLRGTNYKHRKETLEPAIRDIYRKTAREKHEEEIQRRMFQ